MNYANLLESLFVGGFDVILQEIFNLIRPECVEIDRIFYRVMDYFFIHKQASIPIPWVNAGNQWRRRRRTALP